MLQPREEHATLYEIGTVVPVQTTDKWFHGIRGTAEESELKGRTWTNEGCVRDLFSISFCFSFSSSFSRSTNSCLFLRFSLSFRFFFFFVFYRFSFVPFLFFFFFLSLSIVREEEEEEEVQLGRLRSMAIERVILRMNGWCVLLIFLFLDRLSHEFLSGF